MGSETHVIYDATKYNPDSKPLEVKLGAKSLGVHPNTYRLWADTGEIDLYAKGCNRGDRISTEQIIIDYLMSHSNIDKYLSRHPTLSRNDVSVSLDDELLKVTKSAGILGVSPNTIRIWFDEGKLFGYEIGPRKDRRFPERYIRGLLKDNDGTNETSGYVGGDNLLKDNDGTNETSGYVGGDELLGVKEVADILGVKPNTVRTWADDGKIRVYRLGTRGDRRFPKEAVMSFRGEYQPRS